MNGRSVLKMILSPLRASISQSRMARHVRNYARFPGLNMAASALVQGKGALEYGNECSIGEAAIVTVPAGAQLRLGDGVRIGRHVELGPGKRIDIGDDTSIQDRSMLLGDIRVGRHCLLAPNVFISSGRHYYDLRPEWLIRDQDALVSADPVLSARHSRPVCVEDDCWLGLSSMVLPGVTIGKGCVVGAYSIVGDDLPPYSVALGIPAKVVKNRISFRPPRRVTAFDDAYLPYFYEGFGVARRELERSRPLGGILARSRFLLALDTTGCRSLFLNAGSAVQSSHQLALGSHVLTVAPTPGILQFPLPEGRTDRLELLVRGPASGQWPISVAEAWVE